MTYEFAKYPDGTLGVFSNIGKKENGEEYIRVTFERTTEEGFDTFVIELPSYEVVLENGNYSEEEKKKLVQNLTELSCIIKGTKDFSSAQVACGGVSIKEVDEHFESKIVPNLYFVGELLDIDGDCGGYNLGFAWLSGMIVGKSIHQ